MLRFFLFDVDDTLYPSNIGLWDVIGERITTYMIERVGVDPRVVNELRKSYLENFGTALNGLRHDYGIDVDDYLQYVHDLPLDRYLNPDPALDAMLSRLPLQKIVFTNSDAAHSMRVMNRLGVAHHFSRVIDIRALEFTNKPDPLAYQKVLAMLNATADECIFADDALRNLRPAKAIGMTTILVNNDLSLDGVDYKVRSVLEVEEIVESLGNFKAR
ncbi:MAG: pyrimidine 5'-nucleotidase [Chloroflexi bacterium]|nr:pyrimidine 5'-nucleotidase [Chloroflexota bacterium]